MKNRNSLMLVLIILCWTSIACWAPTESANHRNGETTPTISSTPFVDNKNTNENENSNDNMKVNATPEVKKGGFEGNLPGGFQMPTDAVGKKLLKEYGGMFVAKGATPPTKVVFRDESEVSAFQASLSKSKDRIGNFEIELQTPALNALKEAITEAKQSNLNITPRGADSGRRNYTGTVELWKSRVEPGLTHWVGKGKLQKSDADRIRSLSPFEQVSEILKLEDQGMFFAKDLSKSIIYSVAPPGTSQHISMIALDVSEFENARVRDILAKHGWFQTVVSDLPHFTYLGVKESELSNLGLKKVTDGGRTFWIPDI